MVDEKPAVIPLVGKLAPGTGGVPLKNILVNAFQLRVGPNVAIYKYTVYITILFNATGRPYEVTKILREDFGETERKKLQRLILALLFEKKAECFPRNFANRHVSDCAASIYSQEKVKIPNEEEGLVFSFSNEDIKHLPRCTNAVKIDITFKQCKDKFQCSSSTPDNLFMEYANIAVSHQISADLETFLISKNEILVVDTNNTQFTQAEAPDVTGNAIAVPAIKKSVKLIDAKREGQAKLQMQQNKGHLQQSGKPSPSFSLIVDISKHPMHMATDLSQKIEAIWMGQGGQRGGRFDILQAIRSPVVQAALKHLEVVPTHRPDARSFTIGSFAGSANEVKLQGEPTTIAQFFKDRYRINLKHPNWPLVRDRRDSFFPIELLAVCPHQKVRKQQEYPQQSERILKASALAPIERAKQIQKGLNALNLTGPDFTDKTGFSLGSQELMKLTTARTLAQPQIIYGGQKGENPDASGRWRLERNKYFGPAKPVAKWEVWGLVEQHNLSHVGDFVNQLVTRGAARGLALDDKPVKLHIGPEELEQNMIAAKERGSQFVMVISEKYYTAHKELKYLELKYNIPTQEVLMNVARSAVQRQQGVTFDNILLKTNIKNKGLNHDVKFREDAMQKLVNNKERIIIGIEMSHTTSGEKENSASVVGWSANCLGHPVLYTGNFMYVRARETEPCLDPVFKQVIMRMKKYRPKPTKLEFDIYIGGVSEGQMARVARNVVQKLRENLLPMKIEHNISVVVVSLDHAERFFIENPPANGKCSEQNVRPGLIVDQEVTHPSRSEFFLSACMPLQGTIKVPKYTICVDTSKKRTMADFQMQAYGLCHLHQYNTATTSIPTPLYCARDYAQRGMDVLKYIVERDLPNPKSWDLEYLNQVTYQQTTLDNARMA